MIKYRTVIVDAIHKDGSAWDMKKYQVDLNELKIQVQIALEEWDEKGYDLIDMESVISPMGGSAPFTQAYILVFKLRADD